MAFSFIVTACRTRLMPVTVVALDRVTLGKGTTSSRAIKREK
jgi:hypothetical protein